MVYLKLFNTETDRTSCPDKQEYVSFTEETEKVNIHYETFFCRLTLNNGDVVEIGGSGELTQVMTKPYSATTISAEIGKQCTRVGDYALYGFSLLTSVTINNSVTSIGNYAFRNCSQLPVIDNIRYAGTCAVEAVDKTLTSYTFKNGTRYISDIAFNYCESLTSITIPDTVIFIAPFLRATDALVSIIVDENNPVYDSRDNCNAIIETRTNTLVQGCKTTIIPNTVTSIGDDAFALRRKMTSITIPNSVTSIGRAAFQTCSGLTSIVIPDSVTTIGNSAMFYCNKVTSITIGSGVTTIGNEAFSTCSSLLSITSLATTAPTIKSDTFNNIKTNGTLYVPSGSTGYDTWMQNANYYLGKYNWTKVEQ